MHGEMFTDAATAPDAGGASYSAAAPDTCATSTFPKTYSGAPSHSAASFDTSAVSDLAASYSGSSPLARATPSKSTANR